MRQIIAIALLLATGAACAATLLSHYVDGKTRYCLYSNGTTMSVPDYSTCPNSVSD